jgi:hypothetical protein
LFFGIHKDFSCSYPIYLEYPLGLWYLKGEYANLTTLEWLRFYRKDFDILE